MTISELKAYIYENDKVEYILEQIGCHKIKYHKKGYWTCANIPNEDGDGDNPTAINIYNNEYLNCTNYTRKMSNDNYSDIITLTCYNKGCSLGDGIRYLCKLLNLKYTFSKQTKIEAEKNDPLALFKKIKRRRKSVSINDIEIYDSTIIEEYEPALHIGWLREGILEFTREKFNIGFSCKNQRIIIPWRYWAGEKDDYLGIVGRTIVGDYDILEIPKYLHLIPFEKNNAIYGLQENYQSIQNSGYCVVAESEKSCLKRHSRKDETAVAIGGHKLSEEQIRILISLNVDIVLAYDKDVPEEYMWSECNHFFGIRNCYYIIDQHGLLGDKDSPCDAPNKIYNYLLKYKISYDESKRREFVKWQGKQAKN